MNKELERFNPAEQTGRISYEHLHRYALCREYVAGKRVLDMGCGTGYGSSILAGAAAHVTGADISEAAIRTAQARYGEAAGNLEYVRADCYALPFEDDSFDVVVANEIIEHVDDHDRFVAEARRVLAPGGLFLVSTPNKPVYNRYKLPNVFHVSEMDIGQFRSLLGGYFDHVRLTGTRMALISVGFDLEGDEETPPRGGSAAIYRGVLPGQASPGVQGGDLRLADPEYLLAVCSQEVIKAAKIQASLFYSREDDLWSEHEKIMDWASGLHEEHEELRMDALRLRSELDGERQDRNELQSRFKARVSDLSRKLEQVKAELRIERGEEMEAMMDDDVHASARRRHFASIHRQIHAQITDAPQKLPGKIPGWVAQKKTWKQRLRIDASPLHTALFDPAWIARAYPYLPRLTLATLIRDPRYHDIDPHPLFSAREYRERNPEIRASGVSPLLHYVQQGWREGRNPHRWFNNDWYLQQNPDVLAAGWLNPLEHYLRFGWREGRWPNPAFDPRAYLNRYLDVAEAGEEPLTHYVAFGFEEERAPQFRSLDPDWRRFMPAKRRNMPLLDYLLGEKPTAEAPGPLQPGEFGGDAPFAKWDGTDALDDAGITQTLRDFIVDGYGDDAVARYSNLISVMETFRDTPDEFPTSAACAQLIARARALAKEREVSASEAPDATIIVPVYNNILDTLLCLVTVLETAGQCTFDILVADDGSTDATDTIVGAIGGAVHYVRQPKNLGFLGNCNAAAEQARGQHIVLLNNDTLVLPGWLDALVAPFTALKGVGLVGSKLISWDGSLQEAGGIFWKDGSAWNFGRGQDARAPEYSYLRDVDYCSGASIAVPAEIWRQMGGFDPLFTPAYCEDSDLAFRLRDAGFRTIYAPASEVIHHEGRSHGRDLSSGVKAYQVTNQQHLLDRWRSVLERENYPNGKNVLRARDRSRDRHVLIIDHYVPQWDRDAGSRTIRHFIDTLIDDGWGVTFWPDNLYQDPEYTSALQARGVEVIYGSRFSGQFTQFLKERKGLYDVALISRPHIAEKYIKEVRRRTKARIVYYGHDVHFQRMTRQAEQGDKLISAAAIKKQRKQELAVCSRSDTILYPSREEAALMGSLVPSSVLAMSLPAYAFQQDRLDTARAALAQRGAAGGLRVARLLFVGGFAHQPNIDGIIWFCSEIAPILRERGVRFMLNIAGSNPGTDIWALEADDITVMGFVSDERLEQLYRETDVVIAPLRFGAGVKGKVVEAMAAGVPIATTPTGAQGLDESGEFLFLGDTPETLAEAVLNAMDPQRGVASAARALDHVQDNYSSAAISAALRAAFAA